MMTRKLAWIAMAVLLVLCAFVYFWLKPEAVKPEPMACEDIVQGCSQDGLTVQAMTAPKVMHAFEMRVTVPEASSVQASFDMKSMQMGINRYRFQQQPDGSWRARVTLPVCVDGRSDWLMTIHVKHPSRQAGDNYQLEFSAEP
ncbi:hypothetical protein [Methylobacillus sp.]|uniref:hypothetical protein n=1 Tax=Methylobacillus sp. TaxID=56818 RepID=UPI002FE17A74